MGKPFSAASERNGAAILDVLERWFADRRRVLEIGSGTGQHAVAFARALPQLVWQTSDRVENLPGIRMWLDEADLANTPQPIELDVASGPWSLGPFDGVFSANTLHIMAWPDVEALFANLPRVLAAGAVLALYGPFNRDGGFTSASNAAFDVQLKHMNPAMGIRDAARVDAQAAAVGLQLEEDIAMPANNALRIWRSHSEARSK